MAGAGHESFVGGVQLWPAPFYVVDEGARIQIPL